MSISFSTTTLPTIEQLQIHNPEYTRLFFEKWSGEIDAMRFEHTTVAGETILCIDLILSTIENTYLALGICLKQDKLYFSQTMALIGERHLKYLRDAIEKALIQPPKQYEFRTLSARPRIAMDVARDGRALPCVCDYITATNHIRRYLFLNEAGVNGEILECAAGTGYGAAILARNPHIKSYTGVDLDSKAIQIARRMVSDSRFTFLSEDLSKIQREFDYVVSLETIEHVPNPFVFIRELASKLKPGGALIASIPTERWGGSHLNPNHLSNWTYVRFKRFFAAHFEELDIHLQQLSLLDPSPLESAQIFSRPYVESRDEDFIVIARRPRLKSPEVIVVKRANALGDVLWVTPILAALRDQHPDAFIVMMTRHTEAFLRNPHVDLVATLNYQPEPTDRVIDLDGAYERRRDLHLLEAYALESGLLPSLLDPVFYPSPEDTKTLLQVFEQRFSSNHVNRLIAIHAGASSPDRIWPISNWIMLITKLLEQPNLGIVLIGSNKDYGSEQLGLNTNIRVLDLVRKLNLSMSGAALSLCDVLICVDSGMSHLATSVGTPSVVMFGMAVPETRLPYKVASIGIWSSAECRGCLNDLPAEQPPICKFGWGRATCMEKIQASEVLEATYKLLQSQNTNAKWQRLHRLSSRNFTSSKKAQTISRSDYTPPAPHVISDYREWLRRTSLQEIDAELLAERMMLKWSKRPGIHLLLALYPGEQTLLADTLDSLAIQLYTEWLLTIVTVLPSPKGFDQVPNLQWLSVKDPNDIDYVIDEMAAASSSDWLARIEPGLTFEPHTLLVFADYINARPQWHLIYCDEDTREADGSYSHPLFKPDFNLDLLRSQAYFGSFIMVEKEAFLSSGRFGKHLGAENYDLALRILDQVGPTAIGHISQMLAHLPRSSLRTMRPEAEQNALAEHLQRNQLSGRVVNGLLYGTHRIEYEWKSKPLVSLVIPTRDFGQMLKALLDSVSGRTLYPNYEIIIVDNDSSDPETLRYLKALTNSKISSAYTLRIVPCHGEFSWARCANTGAAEAQGEYVLFLDNDITIAQPEWLDRLMEIAQRPDVAIVAPRLLATGTDQVQHSGWILGLDGLIGSPWGDKLKANDPGYMGRALCNQNLSALCGSAMLIRRNVLKELDGFDSASFPLFHAAEDLCLRACELGYKIVWTPYSTLKHAGGLSMQARHRLAEFRLSDQIAFQKADEIFLEHWLPKLANDPAYNRNLSLQHAFQPDLRTPIDWDVNFHSRLRILGLPDSSEDSEQRLNFPLRMLSQNGLAQTMICEPPSSQAKLILSPVELARAAPDVIVMQQPFDDASSDALALYARFLPTIQRIVTLDSLTSVIDKMNLSPSPELKDVRQHLQRTLSRADCLVVSNPALAEFCAELIADIRVAPEYLESELWMNLSPQRLPRRKPRVGWSSAHLNPSDLEQLYPVIEALAQDVDWVFMGSCPSAIKPYIYEYHQLVTDKQAYPQALAWLDLDLAILPLEDTSLNNYKSKRPLLEYAALGWPTICSDLPPFHGAPVTRVQNTPEKWIRTISEQLANPSSLKISGTALQEWVRKNHMLENQLEQWRFAYTHQIHKPA